MVEQVDRDLFIKLGDHDELTVDMINAGLWFTEEVAAIAAHRLAAEKAERPDHCPRKFALAECRKAEIARMREVIEAWHNIDRKRDAEIERLKQLLGEIGQACALADKKYDLPDEISGHLYSRCIRASLGVEEPSHDER